MPDEERKFPWMTMGRRFIVAAVLIIALSAGATATVALNTVNGIAEEVFPKVSHVEAPKSLVTPEYEGGPETFLVLGSDRREGSRDALDRENPPHSDTILLIRFDPEHGQTSVLSIPRDLMVNISTPSGAFYPNEKINAAYTIGSKEHGTKGGMLLAAETIKREVFPELKLNAIVDINFKGFINIVDSLGCAYVNVDHRYLGGGSIAENFSAINIEPGYQKLCRENALSYVRYRHTDSDFVRVARQQDFLRALREQVSPENVLEQIDTVAKAVGHAVVSTVHGSGSELLKLAKLIVFSQAKPVRQVHFLTTNVDLMQNNVSYVTSSPELEKKTLETFLQGEPPPRRVAATAHHSSSSAPGPGLAPTSTAGMDEAAAASVHVPFRILYPSLATPQAVQQEVRPYDLRDPGGALHHAYVIVWQQNTIGGYYDFEGTDWLNPPLFAHARSEHVGHRTYLIVPDGSHVHVVGWRSGGVLYWVTNTLLEELSNSQMMAIALSASHLH